MRNLFVLAGIVLALTACTKTPAPVIVSKPALTITEPLVSPIRVKPVEWQVMTRDEILQKADELEKNPDQNLTIFVLTPKGFANLQANMVETKRYIREQKKVVVYYRTLTGK